MPADIELKEAFLRLLHEDPEFKDELRKLLIPEVATKDDLKDILQEIKRLREDFQAEIKQLREDFNRMEAEIKQLREDFQAEIKQLREDFQAEIKQLREDFQAEIKQLHTEMNQKFQIVENRIASLGGRWGRETEKTIIKALREFFEKRFNVKIKTWYSVDNSGMVYGHPSSIEVDIVISNGEHWLIEYTARVKRSDVGELYRIAKLYEEKEGVKPSRLYIVSPFVDEDAMHLAGMMGIHIITYSLSSD